MKRQRAMSLLETRLQSGKFSCRDCPRKLEIRKEKVAALYLGSSRCARPLPRGWTGHVARPTRSIRQGYGEPRKTDVGSQSSEMVRDVSVRPGLTFSLEMTNRGSPT